MSTPLSIAPGLTDKDSTGKLFQLPKLKSDRSNYLTWQSRIQLLKTQSLVDHIDPKAAKPNKPTSPSTSSTAATSEYEKEKLAYDTWIQCDTAAYTIIQMSLAEEDDNLTWDNEFALDLWSAIQECHSGEGIQSIAYLMAKFWCSMMSDQEPMLKKITDIQGIVRQLAKINCPFSDNHFPTKLI